MLQLGILIPIFLLHIASTNSLVQSRAFVNTTVPYPDDDPFYRPPQNLTRYAAGQIIRTRSVNISAVTGPLKVDAVQLLFRSNSQNGSALAGVTTLMRPKMGAQNDKLVVFLTAEDSVATKCAPSYVYQTGASYESVIVVAETIIAQTYLSEGYTLSIPDYEGPSAAFTVGRIAGQIGLDSARASLNYKGFKWPSNVKIAATGYSGGGLAGGWFAGLQKSYAPELPVIAVSIGGTVANVSRVIEFSEGTLGSGFSFLDWVGLLNAYSALTPLWSKIATTEGLRVVAKVRTTCSIGAILVAPFERFLSTKYSSLGEGFLQQKDIKRIFAENVLGSVKSEVPTMDVQIFHAINDEIIPIDVADSLVDRWCANGTPRLLYIRDPNPTTEHAILEFIGVVQTLAFLQERFAGKAFVNGCKTINATIPVNGNGTVTLRPGTKTLLKQLDDLVKKDIGRDSDVYRS